MTLRARIAAGVAGGIAGGVVDALFLLCVALAGGATFGKALGLFVFIASVAIGPSAYSNSAALPVGILLHFCVAIGWALGYAYLTRSQPQLLTRPIVSGIGFGLVVMIAMDAILVFVGLYKLRDVPQFFTTLVGHCVFYGIPVALVVSRMLRPPTSTGRA